MTVAILVWQAFIFATIVLSGRIRGWVITFWVVWTIFQVVTLPLSLVQFATIAAAFFMFNKPKASLGTPAIQPPSTPPDAAELAARVARLKEEEERRLVDERRVEWEDYLVQRSRRAKRRKAGVALILWASVGAGGLLWQQAHGVAGLPMILVMAGMFMAFINFARLLD